MSNLPERLRQRGNDLGLSQSAAARQAGLDPRRYGHYVNGRRSPDYQTLLRICGVLGVTPDWVLGGPVSEASLIAELSDGDPAEGEDDPQVRSLVRLRERLLLAARILPEETLAMLVTQAEALARARARADAHAGAHAHAGQRVAIEREPDDRSAAQPEGGGVS